jgi:hypothetical protein
VKFSLCITQINSATTPINQLAHEIINQSINQPTGSRNQPTNQPTNKFIT